MKARYTFYLLFLTLVAGAQTAKDYAVQLTATVVESPASITIKWPQDTTGVNYIVYRKTKEEIDWGTALATLPKTSAQYTDLAVAAGNTYEYYVRRTYTAPTRVAHGYIFAGIKAPELAVKGKILLMVDANYVLPLAAEISQLHMDLIADGWDVKRFDISRSATVSSVKNIISSEYTADTNTRAVYLLGRIPVPYSGGFVAEPGKYYPPDGHPDHGGAWPADLYYGTMTENIWTDNSVNDTTPSRVQNDNVPGDGKFDRIFLYPEMVNLQVGRVDLTNMATFGSNDTLRIKRYLDRAHDYKHALLTINKRALIDDNFGAMSGEAFASSGWRSFSTMYGDSVFARDYFTSLKEGNYQFSYGCGAGSYTSCGGVGNTSNYNNDSINTFFTMTFGSYFGDWDSPNNFLRAALCAPKPALASMWSGRPHWHMHHMSLGENIGYSARLSQNNYYSFTSPDAFGYFYNSSPTFIHIALMGDPTLRLHPIQKVNSVNATSTTDSLKVSLAWTTSAGASGYVISRARSLYGKYVPVGRITNGDTTWTDNSPDNAMNYYLVRAMHLEQTPSGSYYNLSLGIVDSAFSKSYNASLNETKQIQPVVKVFPNPSSGDFTVWMDQWKEEGAEVFVYDLQGKLILNQQVTAGNASISLQGKGLHLLRVKSREEETTIRVLITE